MKERTIFLQTQGWQQLVRDDEDGLWKSPQGVMLRAKEAEEHAMRLAATGLACLTKRLLSINDGPLADTAALVRTRILGMALREVVAMANDPAFQAQVLPAMAAQLSGKQGLALRDALRAILALPDSGESG